MKSKKFNKDFGELYKEKKELFRRLQEAETKLDINSNLLISIFNNFSIQSKSSFFSELFKEKEREFAKLSKEFEVKLKAQIDETKRIGNKALAHKIDLRHKELQTEVALGVSKN